MKSPIEDIGTYILANLPSDTPLVVGTNLFYGQLPEGGTTLAVGLLDGPGTSPESALEVSDINNPAIQIMVRGVVGGYKAAYSLAQTVVDLAHSIANDTINGAFYLQVRKMNEPACVGFDSKNRPVFTCYLSIKRSVPTPVVP